MENLWNPSRAHGRTIGLTRRSFIGQPLPGEFCLSRLPFFSANEERQEKEEETAIEKENEANIGSTLRSRRMQLSCRIFGISVEGSRRRTGNFKDSFFPFFLVPCLSASPPPSLPSSPFRLSICRLGSPPAESTMRPQVVNHQPWGILLLS